MDTLRGMSDIWRLRVAWSGPAGTGPGLSTFYTSVLPVGLPASVKAFFDALKLMFPTGVSFDIPNSGDRITVETGALSGAWSVSSGGGIVSGTGTGTWAAGVGARVVWTTSSIVGTRRVKGATFLCPIVTAGYDNAGTLENTNL